MDIDTNLYFSLFVQPNFPVITEDKDWVVGDTYDLLLSDKSTNRVRMEGIYAPENGMPYSRKGMEYLRSLSSLTTMREQKSLRPQADARKIYVSKMFSNTKTKTSDMVFICDIIYEASFAIFIRFYSPVFSIAKTVSIFGKYIHFTV